MRLNHPGNLLLRLTIERDTVIIDEEAWIASFKPVEGFVEGHLAHLLPV